LGINIFFVRDDLSAFYGSFFGINSVIIYCLSDISTSTFENMISFALTHICYFSLFGYVTNFSLKCFNYCPQFINNFVAFSKHIKKKTLIYVTTKAG
jgi:hypothetical protein